MDAWWWGVIAVVVVGGAVVWFGWWIDRRRARAAARLVTSPARTIPGVTAAPTYITAAEILGTPVEQALMSADADLIARRDSVATLPAGAADGAFCTTGGLAVLASPDVLVLDADLDAEGDVATLLLAAKRRGAPLVIVAPGFSAGALGTLFANLAKGTVRTLPVALGDAAARRRSVALTGGRLVPPEDVASGWLPEEVWGTCDGWVSDSDDSWVVVSDRDTDAPTRAHDPRPPQ